MTIKANVSLPVTAIGTTDTVLIETTTQGERVAVSALSLNNTTAGTVNVSLYISPDLTSASGTLVDTIALGANDDDQPLTLIGQGLTSTQNLIAVADVAGSNAKPTITTYDGGD